MKEYNRNWRKTHREQHNETQRKWNKANTLKTSSYRRKYIYGISLEEYNKLLQDSNGICAICNQPETKTLKGKIISLSIDHNHKTGKIRGLLCYKCNSVIGFTDENIDLLQKHIQYLQRYK